MSTVNGMSNPSHEAHEASLRDYLSKSLSSLPNIFPLGLTVLSSSPKRTTTLFPHAVNPPKAFEKEYLITLHSTQPHSSSISPTAAESTSTSNGESSTTPQPQCSPAPRPVLVVALHAYLYTLPSSDTSILYISKVDTSGYAHPLHPIPLARTLLTSFLSFHIDPLSRPSSRVEICLFARSQSQYLFPNSAKAPGKRVSGGLKLCAWWKGVYEGVVAGLQGRVASQESKLVVDDEQEEKPDLRLRLRYLLPSYSEEEARGMLGRSKVDLPTGTEWEYGPPFSTNLIGSTMASATTASADVTGGEGSQTQVKNESRLAWSIPALPDDPKTRFMEEIVLDSASYKSSTPSIPAESSTSQLDPSNKSSAPADLPQGQQSATKPAQSISTHRKDKNEAERKRSQAVLDRVSVEEFWERMGFRQECSSGDVTGFFHLGSVYPPSQVQSPPMPITTADTTRENGEKDHDNKVDSDSTTNAEETSIRTELPILIVDRIHQSLLNVDYGTEDFAIDGSSIWLKSTESLVKDEIGEGGWVGCTAHIPAKENVASIGIKRKEEGVTMLQIKKKPKKAKPA